jgi:ATP-dependent DNA helicase RecQ
MAGCRTGQIRLLYIAPERLMLDNFLEFLRTSPCSVAL